MNISRSDAHSPLLSRLPEASHYCIAYSGGVDSHALLHAVVTGGLAAGRGLSAVHVDHGLHPRSGEWAAHCRVVCRALGVDCEVLRADARRRRGESPEATARRARYSALADWLPREALLLIAQHRDDQAETLLLQLLRGAGARGLAGMPAGMSLGSGRLARPLLHHSRADILAYARRHRLRWIEDPSNADTRYDRNLLRRDLLPRLRRRWPGVDRVLARAASLQADQAELADALGAIDLARCAVVDQPSQLETPVLLTFGRARQRNLLRRWIETNRLPLPALAMIDRIVAEVATSRPDATPLLRWSGAEVRRYRRRLYIMPPLPTMDPRRRFTWNPECPLQLACAGGTLTATPVRGRGLRLPAGAQLEVGFRRGGERLQPAGRGEHHALKRLFQEWGVPDWERARVPLLWFDGTLVAVAGLCIGEGFQAAQGEPGYLLHWRRES